MSTTEFLDGIAIIANVIAILGIPWGLCVVIKNYMFNKEQATKMELEHVRQNEPITLVIHSQDKSKSIQFPATIRRSECSRSEVQGRLSIGGERYNLRSLITSQVLNNIDILYTSGGPDHMALYIPCNPSDLETFSIHMEELQRMAFTFVGFNNADSPE